MPKNRSRDLIRVGDRDGWVCGICRDPARPVHRPPGRVTISAGDLTLEEVPAETSSRVRRAVGGRRASYATFPLPGAAPPPGEPVDCLRPGWSSAVR